MMQHQSTMCKSGYAGLIQMLIVLCAYVVCQKAGAKEIETAIEDQHTTATTEKAKSNCQREFPDIQWALDEEAIKATTPALNVDGDLSRIQPAFNNWHPDFIAHEIVRISKHHIFCDSVTGEDPITIKSPDSSLKEAIEMIVAQGKGEWIAYNWRYKNTIMISHKNNYRKMMDFDCLPTLDPDPLITKARIVELNVMLDEINAQSEEYLNAKKEKMDSALGHYKITYQDLEGKKMPVSTLFLRSAPLSTVLCRLALQHNLTIKHNKKTNEIVLVQNKSDYIACPEDLQGFHLSNVAARQVGNDGKLMELDIEDIEQAAKDTGSDDTISFDHDGSFEQITFFNTSLETLDKLLHRRPARDHFNVKVKDIGDIHIIINPASSVSLPTFTVELTKQQIESLREMKIKLLKKEADKNIGKEGNEKGKKNNADEKADAKAEVKSESE